MRILRYGIWMALAMVLGLTPVAVQGQQVELNADYDEAGQPVVEQPIADEYAHGQAPCGEPCDGSGAACPCNCPPAGYNRALPYSDPFPYVGFVISSGVETFRGVAEGTTQNNNGFVNALNGAAPLPWLGAYGFGAQAGASYGIYDVNGRSAAARVPNQPLSQSQQQVFVSTGFFRRADEIVPISAGFTYDWSFNTYYGSFANMPTMGQWRAQVAWAVNAWNEIGCWGTVRDRGALIENFNGLGTNQAYRAISQVNIFYHRKWESFSGDSWFYIGLPDRHRINQDATNFSPAGAGSSLGDFIVGTNWLVPLNDYLGMYANGVYMKPSAHPGTLTQNGQTAFAAAQEAWDISVGINIFPNRAARSTTVAGRRWMPYLPLANNGNFLVDTDRTQ